MTTKKNKKVHRPQQWRQWKKFPGLFPVINQYKQQQQNNFQHTFNCCFFFGWNKNKLLMNVKIISMENPNNIHLNCLCQNSRVTVACFLYITHCCCYYNIKLNGKKIPRFNFRNSFIFISNLHTHTHTNTLIFNRLIQSFLFLLYRNFVPPLPPE